MKNKLRSKGFLGLVRRLLGESRYLDWRNQVLENPPDSPFMLGDDSGTKLDPLPPENEKKPISQVHCLSPTQRGGSHYLENLLRLHPGLHVPDHTGRPHEYFFQNAGDLLVHYSTYTTGYWKEWITLEEDRQLRARQMLAGFGEALESGLRLQGEDRPVVLRTPDTKGIGNSFLLFPGSLVLLLIRDGRDTAESFLRSWGSESIFASFCQRWASRVNEAMDFYDLVQLTCWKDRMLLVRYEDLCQMTEQTMKEINTGIGLDDRTYPYSEVTSVSVLGSSVARGGRKDVHWEDVPRPEDFQPVGKWQMWSAERKDIFKQHAGKALIRLGYEMGHSW